MSWLLDAAKGAARAILGGEDPANPHGGKGYRCTVFQAGSNGTCIFQRASVLTVENDDNTAFLDIRRVFEDGEKELSPDEFDGKIILQLNDTVPVTRDGNWDVVVDKFRLHSCRDPEDKGDGDAEVVHEFVRSILKAVFYVDLETHFSAGVDDEDDLLSYLDFGTLQGVQAPLVETRGSRIEHVQYRSPNQQQQNRGEEDEGQYEYSGHPYSDEEYTEDEELHRNEGMAVGERADPNATPELFAGLPDLLPVRDDSVDFQCIVEVFRMEMETNDFVRTARRAALTLCKNQDTPFGGEVVISCTDIMPGKAVVTQDEALDSKNIRPLMKKLMMRMNVNSEAYQQQNGVAPAAVWQMVVEGTSPIVFCVGFCTMELHAEFQAVWARYVYEDKRQMAFNKMIKESDRAWIEGANHIPTVTAEDADALEEWDMEDEDELMFASEGEENESGGAFEASYDAKNDNGRSRRAHREQRTTRSGKIRTMHIGGHLDEEARDAARADEILASGDANKLMSVGAARDMTFVTKADQIGVFQFSETANGGTDLSFRDVLEAVDCDGNSFVPSSMMLHREDDTLLLKDPTQRASLFKVDLNRPDIVEEWITDDSGIVPITNMCPLNRHAQLTSEQLFLGQNKGGIFVMDPRVPGGKRVTKQAVQIKGTGKAAAMLSCMATTAAGEVAVGSEKGDIRLFSSKIGIRAKTLLPGCGDPITGIDVTSDGKWVLATTANYLLLIPTTMSDGHSCGFKKRMGQEKPAPIRLQLAPHDVVRMGGKVDFTRASFNTGDDGERTICTSSGEWGITFNFRRARQRLNGAYHLHRFGSTIVRDQFRYADEKSLVVAMEHDVVVAHRKKRSF